MMTAVMRKGRIVEVAAPAHSSTKTLFAAIPGAHWQEKIAV